MDNNVFYRYKCAGSGSNIIWADIRDPDTNWILTYNKTKFSIQEIKEFLYEVADSVKFYACEFDAAIELNIPFNKLIKSVDEINSRTNAVVFMEGNYCYALFLSRDQTSQLMAEISETDFTKAKLDFINSKRTNERNQYIETCRKKIEAYYG